MTFFSSLQTRFCVVVVVATARAAASCYATETIISVTRLCFVSFRSLILRFLSFVSSSFFFLSIRFTKAETSFQTNGPTNWMNHVLCLQAVVAAVAVMSILICSEKPCYTFMDMPMNRNMRAYVQLLMLICSETITTSLYWIGLTWPVEIILLMLYPMQNRYKKLLSKFFFLLELGILHSSSSSFPLHRFIEHFCFMYFGAWCCVINTIYRWHFDDAR